MQDTDRSKESLQSNQPPAWLTDVLALQQRGDMAAALARCHAHLAQSPHEGRAWYFAGVLSCQTNAYEAGVDCLQHALQQGFQPAEAYYNLGIAYQVLRNTDKALWAFDQACERQPPVPDPYVTYAQALGQAGQPQQGLHVLERAMQRFGPTYVFYFAQGLLHQQQGQWRIALQVYEKARVLRQPADLWNNIGVCYQQLAEYSQAISAFETALRLNARCKAAYLNLSDLWQSGDKYEQALQVAQQAHQQFPDDADVLNQCISIKRACCAWDQLDSLEQRLTTQVRMQLQQNQPCSVKPFQALSRWFDAPTQYAIAKNYADNHLPPLKSHDFSYLKAKPDKLRVAYISPYFRNHPTAQNIRAILQHHDREKFEVYAYSLSAEHQDDSREKNAIREACDVFLEITEHDAHAIAERIRRDHIHVAVSLMGYVQHARLDVLAERVAPVQIGYQSYPGTLGRALWDYVMADEIVVPPEHQPYYAEKILYLPRSYYAIDPFVPDDITLTRSDVGLPQDAFVYVCFCSHYKVEPQVFALWMQLLKAVPNAVLWLFGKLPFIQANLRRAASDYGIDPARLIFAPGKAKPYHLARHRLADLALDTFIYNAHTTAVDALKMGIPILSKLGHTWTTRVTASLLRDLGLSQELLAQDEADYVKRAIDYAKQPDALTKLKDNLRVQLHTSTLFHSQHLTRAFENALMDAYEQSCK